MINKHLKDKINGELAFIKEHLCSSSQEVKTIENCTPIVLTIANSLFVIEFDSKNRTTKKL